MKHPKSNEQGTILVLVAVMITLIMIALAMSVDLGRIYAVQTELQNAANAAALAGAYTMNDGVAGTRNTVQQFVQYNQAEKLSLQVDRNDANSAEGGIVMGRIDNPLDYSSAFVPDMTNFNSVQVTLKMMEGFNGGPLQLLLGGFANVNEVSLSARATATKKYSPIIGFDSPDGRNADVLPFTLHKDLWSSMLSQHIDHYALNKSAHTVSTGTDGVFELDLYPHIETPGNFGLLAFSANNAASEVERQILEGLNQANLDYVGGLEDIVGNTGQLLRDLGGVPGYKASLERALKTLIGQSRVIFIHDQALLQGSNTYYKICRFERVTILDVDLNGGNRKFMVQPSDAQMTAGWKIDADAPPENTSTTIYTVSLTR